MAAVQPLLSYILAALAVWRLAVLLVEDAGPWHVFERLRERAGIVTYEDGTARIPGTFVAGVLSCVRCASLWLAVPATVLVQPDSWQAWALTPLALSGAAVVIEVFRRR